MSHSFIVFPAKPATSAPILNPITCIVSIGTPDLTKNRKNLATYLATFGPFRTALEYLFWMVVFRFQYLPMLRQSDKINYIWCKTRYFVLTTILLKYKTNIKYAIGNIEANISIYKYIYHGRAVNGDQSTNITL